MTLSAEPPVTLPDGWLRPAFGEGCQALMSARAGGVSQPPYEGCNLGDHVQDDPAHVAVNRQRFEQHLGAACVWLQQVHGNRIWHARAGGPVQENGAPIAADGIVTADPGVGCVVMVADCLPVLLRAPEQRGVAALHAGWRGLAGAGDMRGHGIVHAGVAALCELAACDPADLQAWLGPCIGPHHFEVGDDVLQAFGVSPDEAAACHPRFRVQPSEGREACRWSADLAGLAHDLLTQLGVKQVSGGLWCTVSDPSRYFSFRRDRVTGRQAAGICLRRGFVFGGAG